MRNTKLLISIFAVGAVAVAGYSASVAQGAKVLTVEKVGGPEVVVGDAVAAKLQTGTKVEFPTSAGEIVCGKSEFKGAVESNPAEGAGNALIKITPFTFGECTTNIAGFTVKGVAIEELPLFAENEGTTALQVGVVAGGKITETGVEFALENAAKEEQVCVYRATPITAPYRNNNEGEIEVDQSLPNFFNKKKCDCPGMPEPKFKAKYRPFKDETGGRAGKQIFLN
jgi:hypothetical protein